MRGWRWDARSTYHVALVAIVVESVMMVVTLIGLVMGFGFASLRTAGLLAFFGSIVGVATVSSYPCCCARREGRWPFCVALAAATSLAFVAAVVAGEAMERSPCVERLCFNDDACVKCTKKDKDGCEPKYSYRCDVDYNSSTSFCEDVRYCNRWDPDCRDAGIKDDKWFWGFETKDDCDKAGDVTQLFRGARETLLAAAIVLVVLRAILVYVVSHTNHGQLPMPVTPTNNPPVAPVVIRAVELAPMGAVVTVCDDDNSHQLHSSQPDEDLPHATLRYDGSGHINDPLKINTL